MDLMRQAYALLPRVKITDLLIEVDSWCDFTGHFLHLKNEEPPKNKVLVLTAVLADAINLGVTRMADACPGISANKLARSTHSTFATRPTPKLALTSSRTGVRGELRPRNDQFLRRSAFSRGRPRRSDGADQSSLWPRTRSTFLVEKSAFN